MLVLITIAETMCIYILIISPAISLVAKSMVFFFIKSITKDPSLTFGLMSLKSPVL